jgi:anaerobic ribonucleoside-triphosphate reductase
VPQAVVDVKYPKLDNEARTKCEIWTRVMGYHRPVSFWNVGKQSEHRERKYFKVGKV